MEVRLLVTFAAALVFLLSTFVPSASSVSPIPVCSNVTACPYSSITDALNAVSAPGTTIQVSSGTYSEYPWNATIISYNNTVIELQGDVTINPHVASGPLILWNITLADSSCIFTLNGTGTLTINAGAYLHLKSGSVVQDISLVMSNNGLTPYLLLLEGAGTWTQNEKLDLSVTSSSSRKKKGIIPSVSAPYADDATFTQNGHLTVTVGGDTVGVYLSGGFWTQNGVANIAVNGDPSDGVYLSGGFWTQNGVANITVNGVSSDGVYVVLGGFWTQNGVANITVNGGSSSGVTLDSNSTWTQYSTAYISAFYSDGNPSYGVTIEPSDEIGLWMQYGDVVLNVTGGDDDLSNGVTLGDQSSWTQQGALTVNAYNSYGVYFEATSDDALWNQKGPATFYLSQGGDTSTTGVYGCSGTWIQSGNLDVEVLSGSAIVGVDCSTNCIYEGGSSANFAWLSNSTNIYQSKNCTRIPIGTTKVNPSRTPSPTPKYLYSNTSAPIPPVLRANLASSHITIISRGSSGGLVSSGSVSFEVGVFTSGNSSDITATNGHWGQGNDTRYGSSQSLEYQCELTFPNSDTPATIAMTYSLFDDPTEIDVDPTSGLNYTIQPSQVKLSLDIDSWTWQTDDDTERASVEFLIQPRFSNVRNLSNYSYMHVFLLLGQEESSGGVATEIQILDVVYLDGSPMYPEDTDSEGNPPVMYRFDTNRSSIIFSFARFEDTLYYDPDIGILLQSKAGTSGGSSSLTWIIAVAVAVPVAIVLVILVIATAVFISHRRSRTRANRASSVNFGNEDKGL